jgi:hypothetical protein
MPKANFPAASFCLRKFSFRIAFPRRYFLFASL